MLTTKIIDIQAITLSSVELLNIHIAKSNKLTSNLKKNSKYSMVLSIKP